MDKKSFSENIKPAVVLCLICFIVCGLLVFVRDVTYVDTTGIITDKLRGGLDSMLPDSSNCAMLTDFEADGITSVIVDKEQSFCAFEITVSGYAKNGLHLLIGIQNDEVIGVSVLTCGETEGLGSRVKDATFLDQFKGINSSEFDVDTISGATYSSKGVKSAVETVMNVYSERKGDVFNGSTEKPETAAE